MQRLKMIIETHNHNKGTWNTSLTVAVAPFVFFVGVLLTPVHVLDQD